MRAALSCFIRRHNQGITKGPASQLASSVTRPDSGPVALFALFKVDAAHAYDGEIRRPQSSNVADTVLLTSAFNPRTGEGQD